MMACWSRSLPGEFRRTNPDQSGPFTVIPSPATMALEALEPWPVEQEEATPPSPRWRWLCKESAQQSSTDSQKSQGHQRRNQAPPEPLRLSSDKNYHNKPIWFKSLLVTVFSTMKSILDPVTTWEKLFGSQILPHSSQNKIQMDQRFKIKESTRRKYRTILSLVLEMGKVDHSN